MKRKPFWCRLGWHKQPPLPEGTRAQVITYVCPRCETEVHWDYDPTWSH